MVPTLTVLIAFVLARFRFGGYLRRKHPTVWDELVRRGSRTDAAGLRLSFDATPELAEFRVASTDDLRDPELAARRKLANRAENLCLVAFFAGVAWVVITAIAIAVLRIL